MSNLLQPIFDFLQFLWPLHKIEQWEEGAFYRFGRFRYLVGPGIVFAFPWFEEVKARSVVEGIVRGNRQDITLRDGRVVSFAASAVVRVADLATAMNGIDQYEETMQELLESVVADKLREMPPARLVPENLGRVLGSLTKAVKQEADEMGLAVRKVRFPTFVISPKVFRVMGDTTITNSW